MNIIAVEDDPVSRVVLDSTLRKLGYTARCVASGNDAWQAILTDRPQVIVSDWYMPGLDGLELCKRVRKSPGQYIYFILITSASADERNRDEAMSAGVDEFLTKPIDEFELRLRLRGAKRITEYIDRVTKLESILPICSYCKKIRSDSNYWQQIESYITSRTGTLFSHSYCPDCFKSEVVPQLEAEGISMEYEDHHTTSPKKPKATRVDGAP
jgi:CheY-like chemotaxis protein